MLLQYLHQQVEIHDSCVREREKKQKCFLEKFVYQFNSEFKFVELSQSRML